MARIICGLILGAVAYLVIGSIVYAVAPGQAVHYVTPILPIIGISLSVMHLAGITGGTLVFAKVASK